MEATAQLRIRLRKLLNERIPEGGTEDNTNFTDFDLDTLLTESDSLDSAVAKGWTEKAGLLQADIESYSIGSEKYDLTSLKDRLAHALAMAKQYAAVADTEKAKVNYGSYIFGVQPPEVL
ncbi:hypothetical protein [Paenibacillus sp. P32E]|uniref:hypothetical protein n=1 Tax=Paenibacillus sp. P32E TaxID=1349434 RepID=UPI000938DF07|nr:hypothetical protein [Paenibacillus sp. P32E]OKP91322.1 hypothetical protein A3848_09445 [Paenibacillus sp. P32E]